MHIRRSIGRLSSAETGTRIMDGVLCFARQEPKKNLVIRNSNLVSNMFVK